MKFIKYFEEYNFNPVEESQTIIEKLKNCISTWFDNGDFAQQGLELIDDDNSLFTDFVLKNVKFDFTDGIYMYQCIITLDLKDVKDGQDISKSTIFVKIYDDNLTLLRKTKSELTAEVMKEWKDENDYKLQKTSEFITNKIGEMKASMEEGLEPDSQIEED